MRGERRKPRSGREVPPIPPIPSLVVGRSTNDLTEEQQATVLINFMFGDHKDDTGREVLASRCETCRVMRFHYEPQGRFCSWACTPVECRPEDRSLQPNLRQYIFERDSYRCHLCGRRCLTDVSHLHPRAPQVDHIIPWSISRSHDLANLATACRSCNAAKKDRAVGEQLRLIG